jgi:hypothetical protein
MSHVQCFFSSHMPLDNNNPPPNNQQVVCSLLYNSTEESLKIITHAQDDDIICWSVTRISTSTY